ncbi:MULTISPECIES: LLM class flavin-dependent oxidoreductase [unclassified Streptomyces]|uniref:LLM class flavin-dependent oxidoreductase n=1 Tax=unclassified Streptomyces TaxID=2593676 RepID=UPI00081F408F|nr:MULTISPECIES: LLM class flavin-dependent oxidoreductase [unclassified Streptomyces]MYZ36405.1 LLM class flavin-dependent oxidoreductase [Streptomyces sp. SID4917]SCF83308.1 alkanesulfonate monooxygenase [Streptomyces sp. MnatMP-M17]
MELDLRGGVRAAPVLGGTPRERQALRFAPDPPERDADPDHVARTARENEEDGLDSALVTQSSSWPDPWLVAAWALAATSRLRIAVAHRAGTTAPTVAARALATLDRLSGGRASAHVIVGSSDADVARDGDGLGKAERYRRAGEYLELFNRTLTERQRFDFEGEFYSVRNGGSGLWPRPRAELLSFGGSSPEGVALAARFAEVYAVAPGPLSVTRRRIAEARAAAAAHGRTLRIWRHLTLVLAATDEEAVERARSLGRDAIRLATGPDSARWHRAVQLDRDRERGRSDPARDTEQITAYVRRSLAGAFVGSPQSVAERIGWLRAAGVDIVQLDLSVETDEDRDLRRNLVTRLRNEYAPPPARATPYYRRGW